jgi:hypothetical protein
LVAFPHRAIQHAGLTAATSGATTGDFNADSIVDGLAGDYGRDGKFVVKVSK